MIEEAEIPQEIRNLDLFNQIKNDQTPARPKNRELYINKLINCKPEDIKNVLFLNDNSSTTFRKDIESITAKKQCERTIGEKCIFDDSDSHPDFNNIDNSRCWLCGYSFMCYDLVDCEHLIPITFAGLFTGIKSTKRVKLFTDAFIEAYKSNYLYAHASCNRSKSSILLIKWNDLENRMVFNEENGLELQRRIINIVGIPEHVQEEAYKNAMIENYRNRMEIICDFINKEYSIFLEHGLSMTDYIKYIVSMTQIYLSKKSLNLLKSKSDSRESLGELASIESESVNVYSIVKLNEKHTSSKKLPLNEPESHIEQNQIPKHVKRLFNSRSHSRSHSNTHLNSSVAHRTRSKRPRSRMFGGKTKRKCKSLSLKFRRTVLKVK